MKITQANLILLILLLIFSCDHKKEEFNGELIIDFPDPIELEGEKIFEGEFGIATISLKDSLLILTTNRDTLFHVYDNNQNFISSFGSQGMGPGEFERPPFIKDIWKEGGEVKALIYDNINTVVINISESIRENEVKITEEFELPSEIRHPIVEVFYNGNNQYIGMYDDRHHQRLDSKRGGFYYNRELGNLDIFPLYNLEIQPYEIMAAININTRTARLSPDRGKFVLALLHSPKLEIFDVGLNSTKRFLLDTHPPENVFDLEEFNEREIKEFSRNIFVTNNFIYLLYSGNGNGQKIKVIEWNGKPEAQFSLPEGYDLNWFITDETNESFYGLSWRDDSIYRFDFKNP
jgi:hypothetical protein